MLATKEVSVVTEPQMFQHLKPDQVVVLNGKMGSFNPQQEEALCTFIEHGGGLVCIGDAAEAYHEYELLGAVLGNIYGSCTPRSEIIARVAHADHYIIRRVNPSFAVLEGVYLLSNVPSDAEMLWRTNWHFV